MFNTLPANPFPPSSEQMGAGGGSAYVLPTASAETLGGVKVGNNLTISDGVLSASASGLSSYHETYTGTGTSAHVLALNHTPILITCVKRSDDKIVISPFSPESIVAIVNWTTPNTGNGTVGISKDNGVKITGVDAGQACNTENETYDVYYLA